MLHSRMRKRALFGIIVAALLLFFGALQLNAQSSGGAILREAWQRTEASGSYDFTTHLTQTTLPAPRITAVGRPAKVKTIYLEGTADRAAGQLDLELWDDPDFVQDPGKAVEIQIEGLAARGRLSAGAWQEIDDFSGSFAPGGDAAVFLSSAKNVRSLGAETRTIPDAASGSRSVTFERYAFNLDGSQYAESMRQQLQEELQRNGDLPPGVNLGTSNYLRQSVSKGEAWIDSNGLPLRLTLNTEFPQDKSGERSYIELQTDFIAYHDKVAVARTGFFANPASWIGDQLGSVISFSGDSLAGKAGGLDGPTLAGLAAILGLVTLAALGSLRRPKESFRVLAVTLSMQMAFAPVLSLVGQSSMDELFEKYPQLQQGAETEGNEGAFEVVDEAVFDSGQSPLEKGRVSYENGLVASDILFQKDTPLPVPPEPNNLIAAVGDDDADGDGLSADEEAIWGTSVSNPDSDGDGLADGREVNLCPERTNKNHANNLADPSCADPTNADTDGDGLTDGEELNFLDTYARAADSDNDGIPDYNEVRGFVLNPGGPRYYLDPRDADMDGDQILDGEECPPLTEEGDPWTTDTTCPVTGDLGVADVFSLDNDDDGVPNLSDLSPGAVFGKGTSFNDANPFLLGLQNLTPNKSIMVDFQLRPQYEHQLSYAHNVLDWPGGDSEGQIQRIEDSTFGDLNNRTLLTDPANNGDMRLTPMLEIKMPGDTLDLPRTSARHIVDLTDAGQTVAYVTFFEAAGLNVKVTELLGGSVPLTVDNGSCAAGTPVYNNTVIEGIEHEIAGKKLADFADGKHVVNLSIDGIAYCRSIPDLVKGVSKIEIPVQKSIPGEISTISSLTLEQTGDLIKLTSDHTDPGASYEAYIYHSNCRDQSPLSFSTSPMSDGQSISLPGYLATISDGRHSIALQNGDEVISCVSLGNIVNGALITMIDQDRLSPYQISVSEETDGRLAAMVPASLVEDEQTGERVAFNARMVYERSTTALLEHEVNLIWVVTMLTDNCPDGDCQLGTTNQSQIIHSYRGEPWYLTGINIQEELGMDVAIAYEDPTKDFNTEGNTLANRNLEFDDNLFQLANGLNESFIKGRDQDNNNIRDVKIQDIEERFNPASIYPDTARFGLKSDAITVHNFHYDRQADLGDLAGTQIPGLLSSVFITGTWPVPDLAGHDETKVTPTFLVAREERNRTLDMDKMVDSDGLVTETGSKLNFNLDPGKVFPVTIASMSWKPYRYNQSGETWEPYPIGEYWALMESRFAKAPEFLATDEEEEYIAAANIRMAQTLYLGFYLGTANAVELGSTQGVLLTFPLKEEEAKDDDELAGLAAGAEAATSEFGGLLGAYVGETWAQLEKDNDLYRRTGDSIKARKVLGGFELKPSLGRAIKRADLGSVSEEFLKNFLNVSGSKVKARVKQAGSVGVSAGSMITGIANSMFDPESKNTNERAVAITLRGIDSASQLYEAYGLRTGFKEFKLENPGAKFKDFRGSLKATKAAKVAGAVGAVLDVSFAFGVFLFQVLADDLAAFGLAFNEGLANLIATAIVAALMLALASTGIGALVVAVIGIIDSLVAAICGVFPPDKKSDDIDDKIHTWFCKGITGLLTEFVAWAIYDQTDIVEINDAGRLQFVGFNPFLVDAAGGFVTGATLGVKVTVKNTIETASIPIGPGALYWHMFDEDNTRKASFAYDVTAAEVKDEDLQIHNTVDLKDHPAEWVDQDNHRYAIERTVANTQTITLPPPGINRHVDAFLAEGYASPAQECITFPYPICWISSNEKSTYNDLNLIFDILPLTLDGFYALEDRDGGKALSWSPGSDLEFPVLLDADGDGLHYSLDPDDGDADNDNDGLTDYKEQQLGTSLTKADTDGDTLDDGQEIHTGTDPFLADSDGDGLPDDEELAGWLITYNTAGDVTRVWSDPLEADEDGDRVLDKREKALGFHPRIISDPTVMEIDTDLKEKDAPMLLIRMDEFGGANTFADSASADSLVAGTCGLDDCPISGVQGHLGNAAAFDGLNDLLSLGTLPEYDALGTSVTFAAWINVNKIRHEDNRAAVQTIIGASQYYNSSGYSFETVAGNLRLLTPGAYLESANFGLEVGQWTHVAVTLEPSTGGHFISFFKNGAKVWSYETTFNISGPAPNELMIGGHYKKNDDTSYPENYKPDVEPYVPMHLFDGLIDEVAVFDRALTSTEMRNLRDGLYNPDDDIVAPAAALAYETNIKNRLISRSVEGLIETELPAVLEGTVSPQNFILGPNNDASQTPDELRQVVDLAVKSGAASGNYEIVQSVGAIVDVPPIPIPGVDEGTIFYAKGPSVYQGFDYRSYTGSQLDLDNSDFSIALWVEPDRLLYRQGLLGGDAGEGNAYPSVIVEADGRVTFGFGSSLGWLTDTSTSSYLSIGELTHIALSYDTANKRAALFIDGEFKENLTYNANPSATVDRFNTGRATNIGRVTFSDLTVKCEDDSGGAQFDLNYFKYHDWSRGLIAGTDVPDDTEDVTYSLNKTETFREAMKVAMCENDDDGSDHTTCDGNDDPMGTLTFYSSEAPFSKNDALFSTTPNDSTCAWYDGYDDWALLDYSYTTNSIPFAGKMKDLRIFNKTLTGEQVTNLIQSDAIVARYKMDERPGSQTFADDVAAASGQCVGGSCPTTGVRGRENVAAYFDGQNDYFSSSQVGPLVAQHLDLPITDGYSFGAWILPDQDLTDFDSIISFTAGDLTQLSTVGIVPDTNRNGYFRLQYRDDNLGQLRTYTSGSFPAGRWHHVYVSIQEHFNTGQTLITLYLDGDQVTQIDSNKFEFELPDANSTFSVGRTLEAAAGGTSTNFFKGVIDDVYIGKEWTPVEEVRRIMNSVPHQTWRLEGDDDFRLLTIGTIQSTKVEEVLGEFSIRVDGVKIVDEVDMTDGTTRTGGTFTVPYGREFAFEVYEDNSADSPPAPDTHMGTVWMQPSYGDLTWDFSFGDLPDLNRLDVHVELRGPDSTVSELYLEGQIEQSMDFDGDNDGLTVANAKALHIYDGDFTVSAWVRGEEMTASGVNLSRPIIGTDGSGVAFFLGLYNGRPYAFFSPASGFLDVYVASVAVPPDVWTHLTYRRSGSTFTIFMNGTEVATGPHTLGPANDNVPVQIGSYTDLSWDGRIDEVAIYTRGLLDEEVINLYNFQVTWLDEERHTEFVVDANPPSGDLRGVPEFLPLVASTLLIEASDGESKVSLALLTGYHFRDESTTHSVESYALGCQDADPGRAFCPSFDPPVEGKYELYVRLVDSVGNKPSGVGPTYVVVDGSSPLVGLNPLPATPFALTPVEGEAATWNLDLSGSVFDPAIPYHFSTGDGPGSGVKSLRVTVYDANGTPVGTPGTQQATITENNWSLNYLIKADNPTGEYTAEIVAVDAVGNQSITTSTSFKVDGTDPEITFSNFDIPVVADQGHLALAAEYPTQLGPSTILAGTVNEKPAGIEAQADVSGISAVQLALEPLFPHGSPAVNVGLPPGTRLYLPFDKSSPTLGNGTNAVVTDFEDLADGHIASCIEATCPVSGIQSRNGQALLFDGLDSELTIAPTSGINDLVNDFTIGAWIKPHTLPFLTSIVATARDNSDNGYALGTYYDRILFTLFNGDGAGSEYYFFTANLGIEVNVWTHVAVHMTAANQLQFFRNGLLVETLTSPNQVNPDIDDGLVIGPVTIFGEVRNFDGAIDEIMIKQGSLNAEEWPIVLGLGPTLHLGFDDQNMVPGDTLEDSAAMQTTVTYLSGFADLDNPVEDQLSNSGPQQSAAGETTISKMGSQALRLSDSGRILALTEPGILPHDNASFSLAFWIKDMGQANLFYGGEDLAIPRNALVLDGLQNRVLHFVNAQQSIVTLGDTGDWHHLAAVWDENSGTMHTYWDGLLVSTNSPSGGLGLPAGPGRLELLNMSNAVDTIVDDLRFYQRPLSVGEVYALAQSGWQEANVTNNTGETANWSAGLPAGLEGYYAVKARGLDNADNLDDEPKAEWSGIIDTVAPHGQLLESFINGRWSYYLVASDFHLVEASLDLPAACNGNTTTSVRETYNSPWYAAFGEQVDDPSSLEKVVHLEIECSLDNMLNVSDRTFKVCDIAGSCLEKQAVNVIDSFEVYLPMVITQ